MPHFQKDHEPQINLSDESIEKIAKAVVGALKVATTPDEPPADTESKNESAPAG